MNKYLRIILYVVFLVIFVTSVLTIDYSIAKLTGNRLLFAIKKENTREQYIEYNGLFYKMWICTAEEEMYKVGKKDEEAPVCPKVFYFENGVYENFNGIKITEEDYEKIKDYFTYDIINSWTTKEDLDKAITIADGMHSKIFTTKEGYMAKIDSNTYYMIAMFKTYNGSSWVIDENDISNHYCIKYNDDKTKFSLSKYDGNTCDENFEELSYSKEWCDAVNTSTTIEIVQDTYDEYCK